MKKLISIFVLILLVTLCSSISSDITYSYRADVITKSDRTGEERIVTSIKAKVAAERLQEGHLLLALSRLTYTVNAINETHDAEEVPFPEDVAQSLSKPFAIEYDEGKIVALYADPKDDGRWSLNFKKAMASVIQFNFPNVKLSNTTQGFYADEQTVYGNCLVFYTVSPMIYGLPFKVTKSFDPIACSGRTIEHDYNVSPGKCDEPFNYPVNARVERQYYMSLGDPEFTIERIVSKNVFSFSSSTGHPIVYEFNQDFFNFQTINETSTPISFENLKQRMTQHKFKIPIVEWSETSDLYDFKVMARKLDPVTVENKILNGLKYVKRHLGSQEGTFDPSLYTGENLYTLIELLRTQSTSELGAFYEKIKSDNDTASLFLQISSLTGTRGWIIFVLNEIKTKQISDRDAKNILEQIPFTVKYPDSNIVKDLLFLLDEGNIEPQLKNSLLLSTASVLARMAKLRPDDQEVPHLVNRFIEMFKTSTANDERVVYLAALGNIGTPKVIKFLETILKSETGQYSSYLRTLAVWSLKSTLFSDVDAIERLLWPIYENSSNPLNLRYAAMRTIASSESFSLQMKLHMQMRSEPNDQLFYTYWKFLNSAASSTLPCYSTFADKAKKILLLNKDLKFKQPSNSAFHYFFDYFNSDHNFGAALRTFMVGNVIEDGFMDLFINIAPQIAGFNVNEEAYYLNIRLKNIDMENSTFTQNMLRHKRRFLIQLHDAIAGDYVEVSLIHIRNSQVISVDQNLLEKYYTRNLKFEERSYTLFKFDDVIKDFFENDYYSTIQKMSGETTMLTDLGIPISLFVKMPTILKLKNHFGLEKRMVNLKVKLNQFNHQMYGVKFYHPLLNAWVGEKWNHIAKTNLPIDIDYQLMKNGFSINHGKQGNQRNTYAFRSFVFKDYFVHRLNNNSGIVAMSPMYTKNENVSQKKILWEFYNEYFDTSYRISAHNCDDSPLLLSAIRKKIIKNTKKNSGNKGLVDGFLTLRSIWSHATLIPEQGISACGIEFEIIPHHDKNYIDFKFDVKLCKGMVASDGRECMKWESNFRQKYESSDRGAIGLDMNAETVFPITGNAKSTGALAYYGVDKNWTACYEGTLRWNGEGVVSEHVFNAGPSPGDGSCPENIASSSIVAKVKGEYSDFDYERCKEDTEVWRCIMNVFATRKYTVDVAYRNISRQLWNLAFFTIERIDSFDTSVVTPSGSLQAHVVYPLVDGDSVNLNLTTPIGKATFDETALGLANSLSMLMPENLQNLWTNVFIGVIYFYDTCTIAVDGGIGVYSKHIELELKTEDWSLMVSAGDLNNGKYKTNMFAKKMENGNIAIRAQIIYMGVTEQFVSDSEEIIPRNQTTELDIEIYKENNGEFRIQLNNQTLVPEKFVYVRGSHIDYRFTGDRFFFTSRHLRNEPLWTSYDGKTADIALLKQKHEKGACYARS